MQIEFKNISKYAKVKKLTHAKTNPNPLNKYKISQFPFKKNKISHHKKRDHLLVVRNLINRQKLSKWTSQSNNKQKFNWSNVQNAKEISLLIE